MHHLVETDKGVTILYGVMVLYMLVHWHSVAFLRSKKLVLDFVKHIMLPSLIELINKPSMPLFDDWRHENFNGLISQVIVFKATNISNFLVAKD